MSDPQIPYRTILSAPRVRIPYHLSSSPEPAIGGLSKNPIHNQLDRGDTESASYSSGRVEQPETARKRHSAVTASPLYHRIEYRLSITFLTNLTPPIILFTLCIPSSSFSRKHETPSPQAQNPPPHPRRLRDHLPPKGAHWATISGPGPPVRPTVGSIARGGERAGS